MTIRKKVDRKHRPRKQDKGHTQVRTEKWDSMTDGLWYRERITCQCGKVCNSRSPEGAFYAHQRHQRDKKAEGQS